MGDPHAESLKELLFPGHAPIDEIEETLAILQSLGMQVIRASEPAETCARLHQGPKWDFLTLLGNPAPLDQTFWIGVVGRRNASDTGLQFACDLASALASRGLPSVSGMARGIDQAAHTGSLQAGGATVGLLPEGLLSWVQRSRRKPRLAQPDSDSPLLLVSALRPRTPWNVDEALRRNRWIAAWCDALVVVEADPEGGTWRTASAASKLGRPLWVVEGLEGNDPGLGNRRLAEQFGGRPLPIDQDPAEAVEIILNALDPNPTG